ncbi:MAG: substrate-binding domain-containing protein [Clostridia bacterium]|nr:substrate-binding domain-containing protein [Clostridia bacterium]
MNRYLRIALAMLAICLCFCFVGFAYNFNEIQPRIGNGENDSQAKPKRYHFVLIAQNLDDSFWKSVRAGAESAGAKLNAAIEYNGAVISDEEEELRYFNIAIASHVDGIAVYVTDQSKFTPLIDKAVGEGIRVITIESDVKKSKRQAFVGPDSYKAGFSQGNLIVENAIGTTKVAIVIGGNYAGNADARASLLAGFRQATTGKSSISLDTIQTVSSEYFGAERIIRGILNEHPEVNMVVSTDADDTLEIVQVLIDLNKENNVRVVGYSNSQQIRNYIMNGNLLGSVYENSSGTGYACIANLVDSINEKTIPSFVDTGVYTITRINLVSYTSGG